jgi:methanethiol S-methyltransferase
MGSLALLYGLLCYFVFLATFGYLIAFAGDLGVPRSVSAGPASSPGLALAVDLALLALFGCQHSLMARPWFKRAWTRVVPPALERSTYVLFSCVALWLLFILLRPLAAVVWEFQHPVPRLGAWAVFGAGVALALVSTFLISHFDLFGLRQVWFAFRGLPYQEKAFRLTAIYARVRHPLMLGFLLAFWATPRMTLGHLVFALGMTAYILVGTVLEERDLLASLGPRYRAYLREVPRFFPWPRRRAGAGRK